MANKKILYIFEINKLVNPLTLFVENEICARYKVKEEFDQEILTVREELNSTRESNKNTPSSTPVEKPVAIDNEALMGVKVEIESLKSGMKELREWTKTKADQQTNQQNKTNQLINGEIKDRISSTIIYK